MYITNDKMIRHIVMIIVLSKLFCQTISKLIVQTIINILKD